MIEMRLHTSASVRLTIIGKVERFHGIYGRKRRVQSSRALLRYYDYQRILSSRLSNPNGGVFRDLQVSATLSTIAGSQTESIEKNFYFLILSNVLRLISENSTFNDRT
jgi:hypothetical protein